MIETLSLEREVARILVVDDEPDTRDVLSRFLALKKYEVVTASSGQAALAIVEREPIDAVLLDINMPGMDGLTTLRKIRALKAELPVLMVTAETDEEVAKSTLKEGAFDYIMKPLNFDYLERTLFLKLAQKLF